MSTRLRLLFLSVLALAASVLAPAARAEDCPHGGLDVRYCDRDGDLVADVPTDARQFIDPNPLVFAYTPAEDPALFVDSWKEFLQHLEQVTGKRVSLFQVPNNAAQFEALRAGRLHVAGVNTGGVPIAVNCAGFRPFTMMAGPDGPFGYKMEIVVAPNSPIKAPADLKGKTVAFTEPSSNSGYKAPVTILKTDFGLEAGRDYKTTFSGKHDVSLLGVVNGDYQAAAVASTIIADMIKAKAVDVSQFRAIYTSDTFFTTAYGTAYNLKPELVEKIRHAFFTFDWKGSGLQKQFPGIDRFIPMSYRDDWALIRKIDAAVGTSYACR